MVDTLRARTSGLPRALLALALLLALPFAAAAEVRDIEREAMKLDQLFLGPCCYTQTLDVHSSQPAQDLRKEIRKQLEAGKTPEEVEAWVIETYGQKILAVPPGSALAEVLMLSVAAILIAGFALLWVGRKWMKRGQDDEKGEDKTELSEEDQAYLDRLDDELSQIRPEG
ncbi:MAG: cytochrome c-type biogenesis protein CcmH [Deltaproteobacteria bacterium]|nr:cytochrome c-type biogenesis protein CcmH [Deltaproteobacteria bacterium]